MSAETGSQLIAALCLGNMVQSAQKVHIFGASSMWTHIGIFKTLKQNIRILNNLIRCVTHQAQKFQLEQQVESSLADDAILIIDIN